MWIQPIDPLGNIILSSLAASTPILVLIILLIVFKMPGYKAAFATSLTAFVLAVVIWGMPPGMAIASYLYGSLFALWPISWIIINAMVLFRLAEKTSSLKSLQEWIVSRIPRDPGIIALFIAFLFGALVEGVDGYGFPIAVCSAMLTRLGLEPMKAVMVSLLANTITVPFASLAVPLITLSLVTGLDLHKISVIASLQLIPFSIIIPLIMIWVIGGIEGLRRGAPIALLSGILLGVFIYMVSYAIGPYLAGIIAPALTMVLVLLALKSGRSCGEGVDRGVYGWAPWIYVVVLMLLFGMFGIDKIISFKLPIPLLHKQVYIVLYKKLYDAVYIWRPLAHGTIVFLAIVLMMITFRIRLRDLARSYAEVLSRFKYAILTILQIVGVAFLMNYSGMSFTLGYTLSSSGKLFPILSAFIGWIGTFVSGSSTGSNALFGNLQRVAGELLGITPYITVAANSTGGVLGKIVCLQSITIGVSAVGMVGKEGEIMRRLIPYSLALTMLLGLITYVQATIYTP